MRFFLTGTDTGVGKTYAATLLLKTLTSVGHRAAGFKPISCGDRDDAVALLEAGDSRLQLDQVNPCHLETAASPYAASLIENKTIDLARIRETFDFLSTRYEHLLVEGVGGWEVPITKDYSVADLAKDMGLPVIIVVHNRLGALNHTILTVKNMRARKIRCAGLIFNHLTDEIDTATITNKKTLEEMLELPVLQEILYEETEIDLAAFKG